MQKKRITIEKLAQITQQGFAQMEKSMKTGFTRVDEQFEEMGLMVKQGFDEVDDRFVMFDQRFDGVDKRLDKMDERFDTVDLSLAAINRRLQQAVYENEFVVLQNRVTTLERHTGLAQK